MENQAEEIRKIVYEVIETLIVEFELVPIEINDDTQLISSLGLNSIDIAHLFTSIDMRITKHLPYESLVVKDGLFVSDLSVADLIDFIVKNIDSVPVGLR